MHLFYISSVIICFQFLFLPKLYIRHVFGNFHTSDVYDGICDIYITSDDFLTATTCSNFLCPSILLHYLGSGDWRDSLLDELALGRQIESTSGFGMKILDSLDNLVKIFEELYIILLVVSKIQMVSNFQISHTTEKTYVSKCPHIWSYSSYLLNDPLPLIFIRPLSLKNNRRIYKQN